ncbi:MAG: elongation factor 1-beta [Thermoplasmata archaeon]
MGDVLVTFKVLPKDSDTDIAGMENKITEKLNGICTVNKTEIKDIGFGVKYLHLEVIVDDSEGKIDRVESAISKVPEVGEISTENVSLI